MLRARHASVRNLLTVAPRRIAAALLVLIALAAGYRILTRRAYSPAPAPPAAGAPPGSDQSVHPSFLYGIVTTVDGVTYEGRLRWGGTQEAFWSDYFNGQKKQNSWAAQVPPERLPTERHPIAFFGIEIVNRERPIDLTRLFMARFGDIALIQASGRDVRVTLKSGAVFDLDRFSASDFDDGVRVWDASRGVTDLDSIRIRTIELLPPPRPGAAPHRLHGTVRTRHGREFTGFLQWDREQSLGSDHLSGQAARAERTIPFHAIRSIARRTPDSSLVSIDGGAAIVLSGNRSVGEGNRGVYVDDPRFGRVLVSWQSFDRVDFSPGGSGPAYDDFPPGSPLTGAVTTRDGRSLSGRLVYDLDESEFTETLDAPSEGVDYTIPFTLIASIAIPVPTQSGPRRATVTLRDGMQLQLESTGDLGPGNAGLLIFAAGNPSPAYVPWNNVVQIALDRPPANE